MVAITKPTDINKIWSSGGDIIAPSDTKIASGWGTEIPPRQYFNWIDNRQDQAIAHINQYGICVWDSVTEYQANKSYVQGATDGIVYRCVLTNVNQNPETDLSNTYWTVAFASGGDFYTKTETDNLYLAKSQNLADLPNSADARTNLSVYAKSETYTKTEVDNKTTVASTAQAQALTSNAVLLTPLRLDDAFKGSNQLLSTTEISQELPGGFIMKSGVIPAITSGNGTTNEVTVTFATPFPTACVSVVATVDLASGGLAGGSVVPYYRNKSVNGANFGLDSASDNTTAPVSWVAFGY